MKKFSNNKGFTLTELIIVIAIIGILAGQLAPQYLSYVERARESNDVQIATQIIRAATVAIADPVSGMDSGRLATFTISKDTGVMSVTVNPSAGTGIHDRMRDIINGVMGTTVYSWESETANKENLVFSIDSETGQLTILSEEWKKIGLGGNN